MRQTSAQKRLPMENSELLPCPMCHHESAAYEMPNYRGWFKIRCLKRKCRVSIKSQPSLAEAVTAWNTRAIAERVAVEEVAEIIRESIDGLDVWEDGCHALDSQEDVCESVAQALKAKHPQLFKD